METTIFTHPWKKNKTSRKHNRVTFTKSLVYARVIPFFELISQFPQLGGGSGGQGGDKIHELVILPTPT